MSPPTPQQQALAHKILKDWIRNAPTYKQLKGKADGKAV